MQNLGLWGDVSHVLQKQHETVFLVVKSYKMWVSGGSIYIYISTRRHICTQAGPFYHKLFKARLHCRAHRRPLGAQQPLCKAPKKRLKNMQDCARLLFPSYKRRT